MPDSFTGYIDLTSATEVSGWVARTSETGYFPAPILKVNGKRVGTMTLTAARPDVQAALGREAIGIYKKLARYMTQGENLVEVVLEETDELLGNGSAMVSYDRDKVAGEHWSKEYSDPRKLILRWWQSDHIVRAINRRVCGSDVPGLSHGLSHGLYHLVAQRFSSRLPFERAVSVGAGHGRKEMEVIEAGLVRHFDLFEVSEVAVERGRKMVNDRGLGDRVTFHLADAFAAVQEPAQFDMVFWNNALHHMPDARQAIQWSHRVLRKGGLFLMDDYVGATRMQFPDAMLTISNDYRRSLKPAQLADPRQPSRQLTACVRPDEDDLIAMDPSECADSANISAALLDIFPSIDLKPTGGGVYHLGLSDVLHNLIRDGDVDALDRAMAFDDRCLASGLTQYAVALGVK